ncbi:MAG TPA: tol-pal system protein YbgF [Rickettsiales bacterium]|nr:tol-pal system protein YbgF [Rickettsiales bacterium]
MNISRLAVTSILSASFLLWAPAAIHAEDDSESSADVNVARLQVKISQLEEEIRGLQGRVEQVSFENKQLKTQMEKQNKDNQFRFDALEKNQQQAQQQPQNTPNPSDGPVQDSGQLKPVETSGGEASSVNVPEFGTSRELYNYSYQLLNQSKYAESGAGFNAFTKRYPKDPLIGNAYYWEGETYYVQKDYVHAADDFRRGYEAMPTGPKAPDNLLRLAMSLNVMKKDREACVILKQIVVKFGHSSTNMKHRAEQEMTSIGCNKQ